MEQVVVITVFAICAAVCVKIFVVSYLMTVNSIDTKNALIVAESAAEIHKAFVGDTSKIAEMLGSADGIHYDSDSIFIYFDDHWNPISAAYASFVLRSANFEGEFSVIFADIAVDRISNDEKLVSLTVAARRGER